MSDGRGATEGKHEIEQIPVRGKAIRPSNGQAPRDSLLQELHEVCKSVPVCHCRTAGGQEQPPPTSAKGGGGVIPRVIGHTCRGFVLDAWILTLRHCGLCYCAQGTEECRPTKRFQERAYFRKDWGSRASCILELARVTFAVGVKGEEDVGGYLGIYGQLGMLGALSHLLFYRCRGKVCCELHVSKTQLQKESNTRYDRELSLHSLGFVRIAPKTPTTESRERTVQVPF